MHSQESFEHEEHRRLHQQLHALADRQSAAAAPVRPPVAAVLRQGRRRRRARVGAAVAGVAACAIATGLLTQSLGGAAPGGAHGDTVAAAPTSSGPTALTKRLVDPAGAPAQPSSPAVGRAYPYNWVLVCGDTGALVFAGKSWKSDPAVPVPGGLPGPGGPGSGPPVLPGYVTVTGGSTARFDAPGYLARPIVLRLVAKPQLCA